MCSWKRYLNKIGNLMKNIHTLQPSKSATAREGKVNHFVDVAGTRVRYIEAGAEREAIPLLMVHGINGSSDYWYPSAIPRLADERHVVAVDLPGNGFSGQLGGYGLDVWADFLPAFMDVLGMERADLLGHSMGGQVAIGAVVRHPERFRKLVLIDSSGLPELVRPVWLASIKMLTDSSMRQVRLYPTFIRVGLRARAAGPSLQMVRSRSIRRELKLVTKPTLIIWGSRDRVVPLEHGAFMAKHISGARLVIIRGAGHMPFYERPEECCATILGFLRSGVVANEKQLSNLELVAAGRGE
jgi:pimeloyl-ACP methyl ester carboxylesterase